MTEKVSRALDTASPAVTSPGERCEVCGVAAVVERKCKVICLNCHTILKTCADL